MNIYRINEVAQKLGISKQTLIRYEKKGIFPHSHRNRINHWREYTEEDVQKMARIIGRTSAGFTLIEFVMVIVIAGIIAVLAVPRFAAFNTIKLNSAVKKIVSDIRYTQSLAVSSHDMYGMTFDAGQERYEVRRIRDNSYAKDPFSRQDFIVNFATDPLYGGMNIVSAMFGNTNQLRFGWNATPLDANNVPLAAEGSVAVLYRGVSQAIFVRPGTGTIRVQ
ncbi:MAG: MerR family transcriptional regulator [Candidatus Omnitrophota bacterium]